jgi:3-phenylpropionate/trans-cinnamate dioxygenase ferredoxin reductase subunit
VTTLVVVGASLAGVQAAQVIRREGFDGRLVLVGDEPHRPYDRPPLSKEYLTADEPDEDRLRLRPTADPDALGLDWRLGRRAVALDPTAGSVTLDDGEEIGFDGLVVATGARPRRLPGQETEDGDLQPGVLELRTLDDARRLRASLLDGAERIVVCGAGFIGAEVAASARARGLQVTLVDAAEVPMERVLDAPAGRAVADLHRANGVDVRLGVGVAGFEVDPDRGRARAVHLGDGTNIEADVVLVGVGVIPNTDWLDGSGLTVDDGVVTDATTLAAPGVVAAGDVARWPNPRFGGRSMRVEQWDNAIDMGGHAGRRLLAELDGRDGAPFEPVPWFWSDQYDRKIQLAGLVGPRAEVVQGSIDEGRFVRIYGDDDGRLCGALCWNRPRQAIQARQLVAEGESIDVARERLG